MAKVVHAWRAGVAACSYKLKQTPEQKGRVTCKRCLQWQPPARPTSTSASSRRPTTSPAPTSSTISSTSSSTRSYARAPHEAIRKVVQVDGQPAARELYDAFELFNRRYFDGRLAPALILITATRSHRSWGDYIAKDEQGLESRIRIAPRAVRRGERFAMDVLLHEMIHAWQVEIAHEEEDGWRGHGPLFARECNRIGKMLGLAKVHEKGARHGMPDCAHWPGVVRPADYYPEPFVVSTRKKSDDVAGDVNEGEEGDGGDPGDDHLDRMRKNAAQRFNGKPTALALWSAFDLLRAALPAVTVRVEVETLRELVDAAEQQLAQHQKGRRPLLNPRQREPKPRPHRR